MWMERKDRSVMPLPHAPFAADQAVRKYDQLSMKDRLGQLVISHGISEELYQILHLFLCMNMQGDIATCGFIDHLRWWALRRSWNDSIVRQTWPIQSQRRHYVALARAMLNDCSQRHVVIIHADRFHRSNEWHQCPHSYAIWTTRQRSINNSDGAYECAEKSRVPSVVGLEKERSRCRKSTVRGWTKLWAKLDETRGQLVLALCSVSESDQYGIATAMDQGREHVSSPSGFDAWWSRMHNGIFSPLLQPHKSQHRWTTHEHCPFLHNPMSCFLPFRTIRLVTSSIEATSEWLYDHRLNQREVLIGEILSSVLFVD